MIEIGLEQVDIVNQVGKLLYEILPNPRTDSNEKDWIYPTFPEKDANLPQLVIEEENETPVPECAGDFFKQETEGDLLKRYFCLKNSSQLVLSVVTSKKNNDQKFYYNNQSFFMNNKLLNKSITSNYLKIINKNYDTFREIFRKFDPVSVEYSFDGGTFFWTSQLVFDIEYYIIWVEETDIVSGEVIKQYVLSITAEEETITSYYPPGD